MGAVKGTVEVALHDSIPLVGWHFIDRVDPEYTGVVDQYIQSTVGIDCGLDDSLRPFRFGDAVIVGDGFTSGLFDCFDRLVGGIMGIIFRVSNTGVVNPPSPPAPPWR